MAFGNRHRDGVIYSGSMTDVTRILDGGQRGKAEAAEREFSLDHDLVRR
jgi:hypothetical protein